MVKVRIFLQLLKNLNLFGKVFGVGITVEFFIGSSTEPVGFRPQLVRKVFVIISL